MNEWLLNCYFFIQTYDWGCFVNDEYYRECMGSSLSQMVGDDQGIFTLLPISVEGMEESSRPFVISTVELSVSMWLFVILLWFDNEYC